MTKHEIIKKFPFSIKPIGKAGICTNCAYFENCDKMIPGFIKPGKCGGSFYKDKI